MPSITLRSSDVYVGTFEFRSFEALRPQDITPLINEYYYLVWGKITPYRGDLTLTSDNGQTHGVIKAYHELTELNPRLTKLERDYPFYSLFGKVVKVKGPNGLASYGNIETWLRPESNRPTGTGSTAPVKTETTAPIKTEATSPIKTEATSPIKTEATAPIKTEATAPIKTEAKVLVKSENEDSSRTRLRNVPLASTQTRPIGSRQTRLGSTAQIQTGRDQSSSQAAVSNTSATTTRAAPRTTNIGEIKLLYVDNPDVNSHCFVIGEVYNVVPRTAINGQPGLALIHPRSNTLRGWVKATRDSTRSTQRVKDAMANSNMPNSKIECKVTQVSGSFSFTDRHTGQELDACNGTADCWVRHS